MIGTRVASPSPAASAGRGDGHRRTRSRGQSLVEFALMMPVALLIIGGALDMGRLFYARVSIENAAREGAVFGSTNPRCDTSARSGCRDPQTAHWRVVNEATGVGPLSVTFACFKGATAVPVTDCDTGDRYEARVTTPFDFVTPILEPLLGDSLLLEASASASVFNEALDPNATPFPIPTPTPSPSPSPSPSPTPAKCTVPNMVGQTLSNARQLWTNRGFDGANLDSGSMKGSDTVGTQSLVAGSEHLCSATVKVTK